MRFGATSMLPRKKMVNSSIYNGIGHQGTIMRQDIIEYLRNQRKGSYQRMTLKITKYGWMNNHIV
jgi:hypothetical protein